MKKKCYHKDKECDIKHRLHTYKDFNGNRIVSCMFHKPGGWIRSSIYQRKRYKK